jgi:hypothetical protein
MWEERNVWILNRNIILGYHVFIRWLVYKHHIVHILLFKTIRKCKICWNLVLGVDILLLAYHYV